MARHIASVSVSSLMSSSVTGGADWTLGPCFFFTWSQQTEVSKQSVIVAWTLNIWVTVKVILNQKFEIIEYIWNI